MAVTMAQSLRSLIEWFASYPDGLTAQDYDALPEEAVCRLEVVDGGLHLFPAPPRAHERVRHQLANRLKSATHFEVAVAAKLRLKQAPLHLRRPDIVVYDTTPRPEHCLLVVEVVSPGSVTVDRCHKAADYTAAGIKHYWRIEDVDTGEPTLMVFRYRLDSATRKYAAVGIDTGVLSVSDPFEVTIDLADLY